MKTSRNAISSILAAIMSCAATGFAQAPPGTPSPSIVPVMEGAPVPVGSMLLYPALGFAVQRDSNIALQPAGANVKSDTIAYLQPSIVLQAQQGANIYRLGYRGEYGRYNSSTADNFENHELAASANMRLDGRNRLSARLQYIERVDPRGTLNLPALPTPSQYRLPSVSGVYTYGADEAQGRLELAGGYYDKRYLNNRSETAVLDHSRTDYGGTFLWRVQPKTSATVNLRQSKYGYKDPASTLDSTDTSILLGARWEATAATAGRFAIGQVKKKFDSAGTAAGREDLSGLAWEGGVSWRPLTHSSVDYNTYRGPVVSTGTGSFMLTQTHQVVWTHAWSSRVMSTLNGMYINEQFYNAPVAAIGGASREDTTKSAGLRVTYNMRRWLNIGADYTYTHRDSNDINFKYNRNQYMLFVAGTL